METGDQQASVLDALREIQRTQSLLVNAVESLSGKSIDEAAGANGDLAANIYDPDSRNEADEGESPSVESPLDPADKLKAPALPTPSQRQGFTSRIILT
ncbi:hypothetical protein N0V84_001158 [Fusarium piperis]|uniref:Uncharacterized protein n=1 Tax=Fusarium piperis TaxID=1435070 RepID=A0A9W9BTN9_9HYPO|nr:hypothetical protein N0V84_001158 [Fusarium piperis]